MANSIINKKHKNIYYLFLVVSVIMFMSVFIYTCNDSSHSNNIDNNHTCIDNDNDEYGLYCVNGLDCDDNDSQIIEECFDDNETDDCIVPGFGCPCTKEGKEIDCRTHNPVASEDGTLLCYAGVRVCENGVWSGCINVDSYDPDIPLNSSQEEEDTGTKQQAIMGTTTSCAPCDPTCKTVHDCPSGVDLNDENSENLEFDPFEGGLIVSKQEVNARFSWLTANPQGTISKIEIPEDLTQIKEIGRYQVGERGKSNPPSRSTIDGSGNAYVSNKSFIQSSGSRHVSTVTKVSADEFYCIDRNNNGVIDTSHDLNDDGFIDMDSVEYLGNDDECIIWQIYDLRDPSSSNSNPMAMAVDLGDDSVPSGYLWIGSESSGGNGNGYAYKIDPSTSAILWSQKLPMDPVGGVMDPTGKFWMVNSDGALVYIDTTKQPPVLGSLIPMNNPLGKQQNEGYGITADQDGRIWVSGGQGGAVSRYTPGNSNPASGTWCYIDSRGNGSATGIGINYDETIWVNFCNSKKYLAYIPSDLNCTSSTMPGTVMTWAANTPSFAQTPIGMDIDYLGRIWSVNSASNNVAIYDAPGLSGSTRYYEYTLEDATAYAYSDFLGFQHDVLRRQGKFRRTYNHVCSAGSQLRWWALDYVVDIPENTEIYFTGRTASTEEELATATPFLIARIPPDTSPDPPDDLNYPEEANVYNEMLDEGILTYLSYFQVEANLRSLDGTSTPHLFSIDMYWFCLDSL